MEEILPSVLLRERIIYISGMVDGEKAHQQLIPANIVLEILKSFRTTESILGNIQTSNRDFEGEEITIALETLNGAIADISEISNRPNKQLDGDKLDEITLSGISKFYKMEWLQAIASLVIAGVAAVATLAALI